MNALQTVTPKTGRPGSKQCAASIDAAIRSLLALTRPVSEDTRLALARAWERVPDRFRTPRQFLGRQYAGCGATIGAMPRCDFACRGCYLVEESNRTPPLPLADIEAQLRQLRRWLGEGGNLQLTDGEVALRDESELLHLIRSSREIGLVPMLMTHGDWIRRDPERLQRLMSDGGLTELSIHVDTTQRGRRGSAYRFARFERDLMPLRDEFADLIRRVRRETGLRLEVATTMTVTRESLAEVPDVIRWLLHNADAFKMISFQPAAQVGRTEMGLGGGGGAEELWERIALGLSPSLRDPGALEAGQGWLGHPDCSRFFQGVVQTGREGIPVFHPLHDFISETSVRSAEGLLQRFGGLTFRLDSRSQKILRWLAVAAAHPYFVLRELLPMASDWWRRIAPEGRVRFIVDWFRQRQRLHYLNIVSHHFMSAAELETPWGRDRTDLCVFKTPVDGELRSMCEVNALGLRRQVIPRLESTDKLLESA